MKTKYIVQETEKVIKDMNKKIDELKHEIYRVSSNKNLEKQNAKFTEFLESKEVLQKDSHFCVDIFRSFEHILKKNKYFAQITEILKNEVYVKPPPMLLDENHLLKSVALSEKALYSEWILQTIIENVPKNSSRSGLDSTFEILSYLQNAIASINIPVADGFQAILTSLDNAIFKILSENEQDLLIFMHATARMKYIFEHMNVIDLKIDSTQIPCSKAKRYEDQKRYVTLLNQLKYLNDGMENIDLSQVLLAITRSEQVDIKIEEIAQAYENFKGYITYVSGEANKMFGNCLKELEQKELTEADASVNNIRQELNFKVQQCSREERRQFSEYDIFQEDAKGMVSHIENFLQEIINMSYADVNTVRLHLNCLKNQVTFLLQSKMNLQKHMLPFVCQDDDYADSYNVNHKTFLMIGRSHLLFDYIEEAMFHHKTLEEMEFNKVFPLMSSLCDLRQRKDMLIEKFRNFLSRIRHQMVKDAPEIKRNLTELNKEIQVLLSEYHKYRGELQFISGYELKNVRNMLEDIEAITMSNIKTFKEKRSVGLMTMRRLNIPESKVIQKRTKDSYKEIGKMVDEIVDFLHLLDETVISKKFPAMRYLCELHYEREQILNSFENLISVMHKFDIDDDDEDIIRRLVQLTIAADSLIKKYETLGMLLMLFSDTMAIASKENDSFQCPAKKSKELYETMNVSDLFSSTEDSKKFHCNLDDVVKQKWFPAKQHLCDLLKDKQRVIQTFQNLLERMPELDIETVPNVIHSGRKLIMNAENVLRKYQSLRMQLIWIAGDSAIRTNST